MKKERLSTKLWVKYLCNYGDWNDICNLWEGQGEKRAYEAMSASYQDYLDQKDIEENAALKLLSLMSDHELDLLAHFEEIDLTDVIALEEFRDAYWECMAADATD